MPLPGLFQETDRRRRIINVPDLSPLYGFMAFGCRKDGFVTKPHAKLNKGNQTSLLDAYFLRIVCSDIPYQWSPAQPHHHVNKRNDIPVAGIWQGISGKNAEWWYPERIFDTDREIRFLANQTIYLCRLRPQKKEYSEVPSINLP